MKTFLFSLLLLLGTAVYAQQNDYIIEVIKRYDPLGNLIQYNSIRKDKNKRVVAHFNSSVEPEKLDSLLQGLHFIGTDNDLILKDSIVLNLHDQKGANNRNVWIDDTEKHIEIPEEGTAHKIIIVEKGKEKISKAALEKKLRSQLKRIQKKLEEIEKQKEEH